MCKLYHVFFLQLPYAFTLSMFKIIHTLYIQIDTYNFEQFPSRCFTSFHYMSFLFVFSIIIPSLYIYFICSLSFHASLCLIFLVCGCFCCICCFFVVLVWNSDQFLCLSPLLPPFRNKILSFTNCYKRGRGTRNTCKGAWRYGRYERPPPLHVWASRPGRPWRAPDGTARHQRGVRGGWVVGGEARGAVRPAIGGCTAWGGGEWGEEGGGENNSYVVPKYAGLEQARARECGCVFVLCAYICICR